MSAARVVLVRAEIPGRAPVVLALRVRFVQLLGGEELAAVVRTAAAQEIRARDPTTPPDLALDLAVLPTQPTTSTMDR